MSCTVSVRVAVTAVWSGGTAKKGCSSLGFEQTNVGGHNDCMAAPQDIPLLSLSLSFRMFAKQARLLSALSHTVSVLSVPDACMVSLPRLIVSF